jgi:hypothetical protein
MLDRATELADELYKTAIEAIDDVSESTKTIVPLEKDNPRLQQQTLFPQYPDNLNALGFDRVFAANTALRAKLEGRPGTLFPPLKTSGPCWAEITHHGN